MIWVFRSTDSRISSPVKWILSGVVIQLLSGGSFEGMWKSERPEPLFLAPSLKFYRILTRDKATNEKLDVSSLHYWCTLQQRPSFSCSIYIHSWPSSANNSSVWLFIPHLKLSFTDYPPIFLLHPHSSSFFLQPLSWTHICLYKVCIFNVLQIWPLCQA